MWDIESLSLGGGEGGLRITKNGNGYCRYGLHAKMPMGQACERQLELEGIPSSETCFHIVKAILEVVYSDKYIQWLLGKVCQN